jgi:hypothetical protein
MKTRLLFSLLAIALSTFTASAADVTGKWKAEFTTPDGTSRVNTFTFKVEGGVLTGSVAGAQDETPIKDAKLSGDDISFSADRPFGTFTYTGKIAGDSIKFKVSFNDQSFEITAKRISQ